MKAGEINFLQFLRKSPQFVIPIYQRTYSWTRKECQQFWDDIMRTGRDEKVATHFMGSVVYIQKGHYQIASPSQLLVIDGQQRLTTVSLLLEALARRIPGGEEPLDGFSLRKIRNYYLLNPEEENERAFKLLLTQTDKDSLLALLRQKNLPEEKSVRIDENFTFFQEKIKKLGDDIMPFCEGLAKLMIVDIALNRDYDNPQLIFESMNSTGRELSQADLIRNFVLMGLELNDQNRLYQDHWRPMEVAFGQKAYDQHFDGFMRHYLTVRTGEIPRIHEVYEEFKAYARSPEIADSGVDALVNDVHNFANHYCAIALGKEKNAKLIDVFVDLRELKSDVAYPFLLELYDDYTQEVLSDDDLVHAVRLVESYVFRRAVCEIPTNSLNKTFATLARHVEKTRYLESIQAQFMLMPSYRRFPHDKEFGSEFKKRNLYNFRNRNYWLRKMENHNRKERVQIDEYTVEHIMPQNENLSSEWRKELGDEWGRIHQEYLHTLGNLTLTAYNPELGDRPFVQKRDMEKGFRISPLQLNQGLGQVERWNEDAIKERAERLSKLGTSVWAAPSLPEDVLDTYRPKKPSTRAKYSIADHQNLVDGSPTRKLFDALRKEIMATDPSCVTEEFFKPYVAYKAETNFVDIVAQSKRLSLIINLDFHELYDPRAIAENVADIGTWGNGDVRVSVDAIDDIPYVMSLIRQAFDKQVVQFDASNA